MFARRRNKHENVSSRMGFSGYSRASAGSYHERMASRRARVTSVALVVAIVIVLVLLGFLFVAAVGAQPGYR